MVSFLVVIALVLGATSSIYWLSYISRVLFVGAVVGLGTNIGLFIACDNKDLPFSFCGDMTGLLNILMASVGAAIVAMAITVLIHWLYKKKKNSEI